ncbi:HAMP domain-containing histidine kinase [Mycoplasmatota bacterium]|nr:HAMP domain-containing histidine kinase [Mycoplasmatota bacterium]
MNDFKRFFKRDFVLKLSIMFTLIFFIMNIGIFLFNNNYENHSTVQKEIAFASVVEHMIRDNGKDSVNEYIEHYSHIHNTSIKYFYNDSLLYETELIGSNYKSYTLNIEDEIVGKVLIDSTYSVNTLLNNTFLLVTNLFILVVYIASLIFYYNYISIRVNKVLKDMSKLKLKINKSDTIDKEFHFQDFHEIYNEVDRITNDYAKLKISRTKELQTITHDMKTPLTILLSYLEGVESNRLKINGDVLTILKEEVATLNNLIESVNSCESEYILEEINLSEMIVEHCERFLNVFDTKDINLSVDVEEGIMITGERESVSRIIYNLLSNSYYYSKTSSYVEVSLKRSEMIIFSVKDKGIGIQDKHLKNIFKKDYRVESATDLHKKGSGLGLYIVNLLVLDLGGKLEVLSKEGVGTEFKIFLNEFK